MPKGVYERPSEEQRFWGKVNMKEEDECWLWLGSKDPDGYGWFSFTCKDGVKKTISAHRYSLMLKLKNFDLPTDILARHSCDVRGCVNPNHLIEGSAKDNSADMIARNRSLIGEKNHNAVITEQVARAILDEYTADKQSGRLYGSLERIAKKHNLSKQSVYRVTSGKTWKHLERS